MSFTAGVIRGLAENRLPFFNKSICGPTQSLYLLSQVARDLTRQLAEINPAYLTTAAAYSGPFTTGLSVNLPFNGSIYGVLTVVATRSDGTTLPVNIEQGELVGMAEQVNHLALAQRSDRMIAIGAQAIWDDVATLTYYYIPLPTDMTDSTTLTTSSLAAQSGTVLPDSCEDALVTGLMVRIAERHRMGGFLPGPEGADIMQMLRDQKEEAWEQVRAAASQRGIARKVYDLQVI